MKKNLWFTITILGFSLLGCENYAKLAQSAQCIWHTTMQGRDYEGTPFTQELWYKFVYMPENVKDGGTFIEETTFPYSSSGDGMSIRCYVTTSIQGEWEILEGDLWLTYNLNSLNITIPKLDYKITNYEIWMESQESTTDIFNQFATFLGMLGGKEPEVDKNALAEEIRKDIYPEVYFEYEIENNEGIGSCYENLQIENDILSFTTSDVGRISLKKVEDNQ